MNLLKNVSLAERTTFGIGGIVPYFIEIGNKDDLIQSLKFIKENHLFYFILGEGSNTIGIEQSQSLAILHPINNNVFYKIENKEFIYQFPTSVSYQEFYQIEFDEILYDYVNFYRKKNTRIQITADAGVNWDYFVFFNLLHGIINFTPMSGIPGKVGSTPIQNVGAYGEEIKNFLKEVHAYFIENHTIIPKIFNNNDCHFRYRDSIFKKYLNRFFIEKVVFEIDLKKDIPIKYPELQKTFYSESQRFSLNQIEDEFLKSDQIKKYYRLRKCVYYVRSNKGMILNGLYSKSAGSFFTNPIITEEKFLEIKKSINQLPFYIEDGLCKIPAAWLIEYSGIKKGDKNLKNNLGISPLHALAIINYGADLNDLKEFIKYIQDNVYKKTNLFLRPEPIFMENFICKF